MALNLSTSELRHSVDQAMREVFSTMLHLNLETLPSTPVWPPDSECLISTLNFTGGLTGAMTLLTDIAFARQMIKAMFGEEEEPAFEEISDALSEIATIVCGRVRSFLAQDGWSCVLSFPHVEKGHEVLINIEGNLAKESLYYQHGSHCIAVTFYYKTVYRRLSVPAA